MRVAALYDVHGNVHVLEAVLGDVEREGVDEIVFGGDIAAGPFPMEPLAPVRSLDVEAAAARIRASGWPTAEQFATVSRASRHASSSRSAPAGVP